MQRKEKGKTLTKNDLAKKVCLVTGSLKDASKLTEDYFDETASIIMREGVAKVYGLGTFKCRNKAQRVGRNPRSGEEKIIKSRRVVTFKASSRLKGSIGDLPDPDNGTS